MLTAVSLALGVQGCGGSGGGAPSPDPPAPPSGDAGPVVVQPGAPGEPTRTVDPSAVRPTGMEHTEADVRFMRGMIPHHAQALEMVDLIEERTDSEELVRLGMRIAISQRDEIRLMERWLEERSKALPLHSRVDAGEREGRVAVPLMPGMLSPERMAELEAARGREFERLWLEYMIDHHGGARIMVRKLFAAPGAGREPTIFRFATDVSSDQLAEIRRMRRMLDSRR